jgi:hypothetical protein
MDDLRPEIRAAFEKEQAAYPPPPINLRHDLARAATRQARREMNPRWLAVAATILIGVLVVVGLMASRLNIHRPVNSNELQFANYGEPPAGVPLFYVADPNHASWYLAFDWTGKPRGTIKLAQPIGDAQALATAPDGSAFVVAPFKGDGGFYLDRLGRRIDGTGLSAVFMWSDDSKQVCSLDYTAPDWRIAVAAPGASPAFRTVQLDPSIVRSGVIGVTFAACSPKNNKAVLTRTVAGYKSYEWIIRLSDGAVLSERTFAPNMLASIVASPDGSLVAENSDRSAGYLGASAPATTIRNLSTGVTTTLDPGLGVLAFSGDRSDALVTTAPLAEGVVSSWALVDLASGAKFFSASGDHLAGFVVEPGGKGFALFENMITDQSPHPRISVYLIGTRHDGYLPYTYKQP